jgi:hypothetical protein
MAVDAIAAGRRVTGPLVIVGVPTVLVDAIDCGETSWKGSGSQSVSQTSSSRTTYGAFESLLAETSPSISSGGSSDPSYRTVRVPPEPAPVEPAPSSRIRQSPAKTSTSSMSGQAYARDVTEPDHATVCVVSVTMTSCVVSSARRMTSRKRPTAGRAVPVAGTFVPEPLVTAVTDHPPVRVADRSNGSVIHRRIRTSAVPVTPFVELPVVLELLAAGLSARVVFVVPVSQNPGGTLGVKSR